MKVLKLALLLTIGTTTASQDVHDQKPHHNPNDNKRLLRKRTLKHHENDTKQNRANEGSYAADKKQHGWNNPDHYRNLHSKPEGHKRIHDHVNKHHNHDGKKHNNDNAIDEFVEGNKAGRNASPPSENADKVAAGAVSGGESGQTSRPRNIHDLASLDLWKQTMQEEDSFPAKEEGQEGVTEESLEQEDQGDFPVVTMVDDSEEDLFEESNGEEFEDEEQDEEEDVSIESDFTEEATEEATQDDEEVEEKEDDVPAEEDEEEEEDVLVEEEDEESEEQGDTLAVTAVDESEEGTEEEESPRCEFCPDGFSVPSETVLPTAGGETCAVAGGFAATISADNPACPTIQLAQVVCCPPPIEPQEEEKEEEEVEEEEVEEEEKEDPFLDMDEVDANSLSLPQTTTITPGAKASKAVYAKAKAHSKAEAKASKVASAKSTKVLTKSAKTIVSKSSDVEAKTTKAEVKSAKTAKTTPKAHKEHMAKVHKDGDDAMPKSGKAHHEATAKGTMDSSQGVVAKKTKSTKKEHDVGSMDYSMPSSTKSSKKSEVSKVSKAHKVFKEAKGDAKAEKVDGSKAEKVDGTKAQKVKSSKALI